MTIYTIVNGLIDGSEAIRNNDAIWCIMSAASILQGGNPFFVPDFSGRFEARSALALRIGKLGKGIARRFAARYVEAVAPAILFVAPDLLESLRDKGLPWALAINYDRSLALGRFRSVSFEAIPESRIGLKMTDKNKAIVAECVYHLPNAEIGETLECLSRDNTLKTGDVILIVTEVPGPTVRPGLTTILTLDGEDSLRFNIR